MSLFLTALRYLFFVILQFQLTAWMSVSLVCHYMHLQTVLTAYMNDSKQQLQDSESSEQETSRSPSKKIQKKVNAKSKQNIIINTSDCQYPVVGKVAKHFGWKKQKTPDTFDWDICWTDNAVQPETLVKMELHQKINHFPAMYNLARKNLLGRGLMRMRKKFPDQYDFFPLTWMLPVEYHELKAYFDGKIKGKARTFIVKPQCLSQGKGIFLTRKLEDINPSSHCVVQRYIHKPYLVEGLKFDLRLYVLIASVDPLTIYLYEEGLGRFATEEYEAPTRENMDEVCMHLTNYAINKDNPKFVFNQSEKDMSKGHKRSLTSVYQLLKSQGVNVDELKTKIKDCIIKTMISGLPHLTNTYRSCQPQNYAANMCFQLLGFDVLINDKAEPIILEINHTPSFTTDTPLDHHIKFNYIRDALAIMNINQKIKNEVIKTQKQACQQRVVTGKKVKLTIEEREARKKQAVDKKLKYQKKNLGKFERIYPTEDEVDLYKKFIQYSDEVYQTQVGGKKIKKNEKAEEIIIAATSKVKAKRIPISTTPDLFTRKPIAERKYDSKKSINTAENQNTEQKIAETKSMVRNQPLSSFDKVMKEEGDYLSMVSKTQKTEFEGYKMLMPPPQTSKGIATKEKDNQKNFFQDQCMRQFRSIKKFGGNNCRESVSQKFFTKQKDKFLARMNNPRDKIPIALNTLLINGLEQHNNFLIGNLKKFVIGQNSRN